MSSESSSGVVVARGASYLFFQGLISNLASLVFFGAAARILSVEEIGLVSALGIITTLFFTFGTLAIPLAATKFVSEAMGKGESNVAKGVYRRVVRFGFIVSFLSSFLCLVASPVVSASMFGGYGFSLILAVLSLDIFALIFSSFFNGVLLGLQGFRQMALSTAVLSSVRCGVSLFFLFLGFKLMGVVFGWIVGDFVGLFLLFFFASSSFARVKGYEASSIAELFKFSGPLYFSGILNYFSQSVERFIIIFLAGFSTLGVYSVAMAVVRVLGLVSGSIGSSLFPQLSRLYGGGGRDSLVEASVKASRYVCLIYVPLAVGLAATAYPAITLFAGLSYESGWLPMVVVALVGAVTCVGFVVNSLLLSIGVTRVLFEANAVAISVGVVGSVLLVAPFGSVGAAMARGMLMVAYFVYAAYSLWKVFGFYVDWKAFKMALLGSVVMLVAVVLVQLVWFDRIALPLYVFLGGSVYLLMLRFLKVVNEEDIQLLRQFAPERFLGLVDLVARFFGLEGAARASSPV